MVLAKRTESIKVIYQDGLKDEDTSRSSIDGVIVAILRAGAALSLLRELWDFSKIDDEALKKVLTEIPGLKELKKG